MENPSTAQPGVWKDRRVGCSAADDLFHGNAVPADVFAASGPASPIGRVWHPRFHLRQSRAVQGLRLVLVLAVLACWAGPGAAALSVGIHLLVDDHHATSPAQAEDHDHDVITSTADGREVLQSRRTVPPDPGVDSVEMPRASMPAGPSEIRASEIVSTAAPPGALFLVHCTLLI